MKLDGLSIIGASRGAPGGETFAAINPVNGLPLPAAFHSASLAEVDAAAELAGAAFSILAQWPGAKRAALLDRIAASLEAGAEQIIERAGLETGLPTGRMQGELARTCFQLRFCGQAAASGLCAGARVDHADPNRKPQPKPDLRSMMRPIGPVAVFGASNFPLAFSVAGGDTASALAAGCPVIVKAHPAHPGTSEIAGRLIRQAVQEMGAPEGVFSLLFDSGYGIGAALVRHPLVKAAGFTGSRPGGLALMEIASARPEPIPVFAEMSSVNPVFILPGALSGRGVDIAVGLHASVVLGIGQFCTNPGLVFIQAGAETGPFLARLEELFAITPPSTMLTAGICAAYRAGMETLSNSPGVKRRAISAGTGGGEAPVRAALFSTDAKTFLGDSALMKEVFGPSTLIVECASREEMLAAANHIEGQLTATIHAEPGELAGGRDVVEVLSTKAGRLVFNAFPTGVEVAHAMTHGGPFPATSDGRSTSVGTRAIERFLRPVSYQDFPDEALPPELQEANPLGIARLVDGKTEAAPARP